MAKPPSKDQLAHAQKATHRDSTGKFKTPPAAAIGKKKLKPAELDQDDGGRYDASKRTFPQN